MNFKIGDKVLLKERASCGCSTCKYFLKNPCTITKIVSDGIVKIKFPEEMPNSTRYVDTFEMESITLVSSAIVESHMPRWF